MIKFPQLHIAESVTNRILNIADGLPDRGSRASVPTPPPSVPETRDQGAAIDAALVQPLPAELPGIGESPDPGATVGGAPLLETLLEPES